MALCISPLAAAWKALHISPMWAAPLVSMETRVLGEQHCTGVQKPTDSNKIQSATIVQGKSFGYACKQLCLYGISEKSACVPDIEYV